jgi:hypothetical protein
MKDFDQRKEAINLSNILKENSTIIKDKFLLNILKKDCSIIKKLIVNNIDNYNEIQKHITIDISVLDDFLPIIKEVMNNISEEHKHDVEFIYNSLKGLKLLLIDIENTKDNNKLLIKYIIEARYIISYILNEIDNLHL